MSNILHIAVAGSTSRTTQVTESLLADPRFKLSWILTPAPKKVGRTQELQENPLHSLALAEKIPAVLIDEKIDQSIKNSVLNLAKPDILLVVDFGYFVPNWLLALPKIAPVNIHPSALPRWRGSSPGQFCLLYGESVSAVTLMVMDDQLDHGPIISQLPFNVQPHWTQNEYYQHSFSLICSQLGDLLSEFATNPTSAQPQPDDSPTPLAQRLNKTDTFVEWNVISALMRNQQPTTTNQTSALLTKVAKELGWARTIENASRAFTPWPNVWTIIPTTKGEKRMKILEVTTSPRFQLKTVQIEGQLPAVFSAVKNAILE